MGCENTILVVEDDSVSLTLIQAIITRIGYKVVTANDGAEAWERFDANPFRIVISDWQMPKKDGLELCELIRARPETPYVYYILLTAESATEENYQKASESGVDDFLTKPLNSFLLRTRLHVAERFIEHTRTIRELKQLIPICSYCKKVRNDDEYWEQIESYLHRTAGTDFTHGICPTCYEKLMNGEMEGSVFLQ